MNEVMHEHHGWQRKRIKRELILKIDDDDVDTALLRADLEAGVVSTNCGDSYMDYDISIDEFLNFADFVRANLHCKNGKWEGVAEVEKNGSENEIR